MRDIIHVETRDGKRPHIVPARRLFPAKCGIARLERPCNERAEAARLLLQTTDVLHVLHALRHRLAEADDHRCRRLHADLVRRTHHAQPVLGHDLFRCDEPPHAVDEDLRPATGERGKPRILQPTQCVLNRNTLLFGKVQNLRCREGVDHDGGIALTDRTQHIFIVGKRQIGVNATLDHDLRAARRRRLADLRENLLHRQEVAILRAHLRIECTETAFVHADIRVVDVAVNDERHRIAEPPSPLRVRSAPEFDRVAVREEIGSLLLRESHAPSPAAIGR